jgi:hypothetical protein
VLHSAPSAAGAEQLPAIVALHTPLPGHTAYVVGTIESAPQVPPADASVSWKHRPLCVLQPMPSPRSQSSCTVHESPILPLLGAMHIVAPGEHTLPVLHALFTHASPGLVTAAQVPHTASGARAQKVDAHCASSPQGAPCARAPGFTVHDGP